MKNHFYTNNYSSKYNNSIEFNLNSLLITNKIKMEDLRKYLDKLNYLNHRLGRSYLIHNYLSKGDISNLEVL